MATIITYDIPSKHIDFKAAMNQLGYTAQLTYDGKTIYLPNTTLYHSTKGAETARNDAATICTSLAIKLERCVTTQWGPNWAVIYGEPFKS